MASEVNKTANNDYDESIDIWSMGVILFEILTEQILFNEKTMKQFDEILDDKKKQDWIDLNLKLNLKLSIKEIELVNKMLKVNQTKRVTAQQFIQKINEWKLEFYRIILSEGKTIENDSQYERAKAFYNKAMLMNPNYSDAYNNKDIQFRCQIHKNRKFIIKITKI